MVMESVVLSNVYKKERLSDATGGSFKTSQTACEKQKPF
jgi:hypothetical protein